MAKESGKFIAIGYDIENSSLMFFADESVNAISNERLENARRNASRIERFGAVVALAGMALVGVIGEENPSIEVDVVAIGGGITLIGVGTSIALVGRYISSQVIREMKKRINPQQSLA